MDRKIDGQKDRWIERQMDRKIDGQKDRWIERQIYDSDLVWRMQLMIIKG